MWSSVILWSLGTWSLAATAVYLTTIILPRRRVSECPASERPAVSVVVPVKGIEAEFETNINALFGQSYADFQLLFMVAEPTDPAIAMIEAAIARHPAVDARVIVGDCKVSDNPKVNNLVKSEAASLHQLLCMCDSNIAVQRDMLESMAAMLRADIGLVSAIPVAVRPGNFVGELECAVNNGFGSRWLVAASKLGFRVAVGKIMLLRKADLVRIGGIRAMAAGVCEDSALAAAIGALDLGVVAAAEPAIYPVGRRRFREFWERQLRWHCCRRCHHAGAFYLQPLLGSIGAALAFGLFCHHFLGPAALPATATFLVTWLGLEAVFLHRQGWPFSWRSPLAWLVRDLLLPVIWVQAAATRTLTWRGTRMKVDCRRMGALHDEQQGGGA